nr:hypothetical protein CFP56_41325 [Quercus suber]
MFFKRLSRSRSNSQSYVDSYHSPHDSKANSQNYDEKYADQDADTHHLPPGSRQSNLQSSAPGSASYQQQSFDDRTHGSLKKDLNSTTNTGSNSNMYPRQSASQDIGGGGGAQHYPGSPTMQRGGGMSNGYPRDDGSAAGTYDSIAKHEAAPDLLTQAFNLALKPHVEKVDALEGEIADLRAYIDQLEAQRNEVHAWIDKRGLRPGKLPYTAWIDVSGLANKTL